MYLIYATRLDGLSVKLTKELAYRELNEDEQEECSPKSCNSPYWEVLDLAFFTVDCDLDAALGVPVVGGLDATANEVVRYARHGGDGNNQGEFVSRKMRETIMLMMLMG